jgi:hypothetical protein
MSFHSGGGFLPPINSSVKNSWQVIHDLPLTKLFLYAMIQLTEITTMNMTAILKIAIQVLKDWRVIVIAIAIIFYLSFYISIISYRKKPKKIPVKKKPAPPKQQASKKAEDKDDEENDE